MRLALTTLLTLTLAGCGGGGGGSPATPTPAPTPPPPPARGSVIGGGASAAPVSVGGVPLRTLEPSVFGTLLDAAQPGTTALIGKPVCAVTTHRVRYHTVGGQGERTEAGAAIMVPSGGDASCAGPRPVLLYAHGTSVDKAYDMAALTSTEPRLVAAMFAARGYIVVAPNYAGYAGSALDYHPYLIAEQQAGDMLDALRAARSVFGAIQANAGGKLFVSGYSQGGYVALATQRAIQAQGGSEFALGAVGAMSGPYALLQVGDAIFGGAPTSGVLAFLPMLLTAGQRSNAMLYGATSEVYEAPYAAGIEQLLPNVLSLGELTQAGRLPANALFAPDSLPQAPGYGSHFGAGNLVKSSYRGTYLSDLQAQPCGASAGAPLDCAPAHPLRRLFRNNDLRNFTPAAPLMLCGGRGDPTVPFQSTVLANAYFQARGAAPIVLDLDNTPSSSDPYRQYKLNFLTAKAALLADALRKGESPERALETNYHAGLVPPFCLAAVRDFFDAAVAR